MLNDRLHDVGDVIVIEDKKTLFREYKAVDKLYALHNAFPSKELRESITLFSFMFKNFKYDMGLLDIQFPFSITKTEAPDFLLSNSTKVISVEVVKLIPKNIAALIRLVNRTEGCDSYETDISLYDDSKMKSKDELMTYLYYPGQGLSKDEMIGWIKERYWAKNAHGLIRKKSKQKYNADILLFDDHHISSCHQSNITKQIGFFYDELENST